MSTSRCVFNAASALRRIFLAPIDHSSTPLLRPSTFSSHLTRIHASHTQQRTLLKSTSCAVPEQRLPRDEEIKDVSVRLKNHEQKLDPPKPTSAILKSINLKTHMLQIIAYSDDGEPPIAKIIDKEEAARQKRLAKKKKNPAAVTKTIEMNWAIGKNDLGHRLQRIRSFGEGE
ncbi:87794d47-9877-4d79-86e4-ba28b7328f0a-CDS [Sclerotinia trifoliorum]|uniref:87794d47-9877-4d79-86e4-ba28b7328f0a-CDS n=1 Tax=Sclerotinia trifoliorum TaxID=28548 RepID=A0A8H2VSL1_9HELO|nr:87794d47-9877-4d79-86e4-ba28b7328f0a-CDS [Sclerotinia trifoliorum]